MEAPAEIAPRRRWLRVAALAAVLGALYLAARTAGWTDDLSGAALRGRIQEAGTLGYVLFVLLFILGHLMQLPGNFFVAGAALTYGPPLGFALSLFAAVLAVTVSFLVVRTVGGKALTEIRRPFVRRMLAHLDQRPVLTVIGLRTVLWLSPQLTYALALSGVRTRDFVLGSALGLLLPVLGGTLLFHRLLG